MTSGGELQKGDLFGHWRVVDLVESDKRGRRQWLCRCVCGVERIVNGKHLRRGNSRSCGCNGRSELRGVRTGARFGKLTVLHEADDERTAKTGSRWVVGCDCGARLTLTRSQIFDARRSCGCTGAVSYAGRKFGKLVVTGEAQGDPRGRRWRCRCECGAERVYHTGYLARVRSCGCVKRNQKLLNGVVFYSDEELATIVGLKSVTLKRRLRASGGKITAKVLALVALRPGATIQTTKPTT